VKPEDFDWEAFEGGDEEYTVDERERLDVVYGDTLNTIKGERSYRRNHHFCWKRKKL